MKEIEIFVLRYACVYLTSGFLYYWTTATDWFACCAVNFMWSSFACMYYGLLIHFAVYEWKTEPGMVSFAFVCPSVLFFCMSLFVYVTGFVKRGLIHASDFASLMSHNFVCD